MASDDESNASPPRSEENDGSPILMCTACGTPTKSGQDFCDRCGAPVSIHAFNDPVKGVLTRGFALQEGSSNPRNLIVVIGVCLFALPVLCVVTVYSLVFAGMFFDGLDTEDSAKIATSAIFFVGSTALVVFLSTIILKTIRNYRLQTDQATNASTSSNNERVTDSHSREEDDENTCLSCGKGLAADADECPNCGWSFR